jgi:hypothetical protein
LFLAGDADTNTLVVLDDNLVELLKEDAKAFISASAVERFLDFSFSFSDFTLLSLLLLNFKISIS